jgi:hypothetical protein
MAKLDFAKAKADIAEIVEIVKTVPEALQQRCFELLFDIAFASTTARTEPKPEPKGEPTADEKKPLSSDKKLPPNVLAFIHRNDVTRDDLGKLFMLDHDPLLPIYKMPSGNIAKSQLTKVMMVLLENGLLNNSLNAPYAELREALKDDGLYDGNLNKNLKRNHGFFRGAIGEDSIDENGTVELTGSGMEKLAEVIKELGS